MKAINGNLDMSKKYKLVDVEYGELAEGSGECCQNCGNIIANVAIVEQDNNKRYRIGLDCMNVIVNLAPSEKQEAKNRIARERKFYKHLATEVKSIVHASVYNTAWTYKKIVQCWDVNFRYKFSYIKWQNTIEKLHIPVIIDTEK